MPANGCFRRSPRSPGSVLTIALERQSAPTNSAAAIRCRSHEPQRMPLPISMRCSERRQSLRPMCSWDIPPEGRSPGFTSASILATSSPRRLGMTEPERPQLSPYQVELEAGKRYAWCRCGRSQKQPFCDGSHAGTGIEPLMFTAERTELALLCGCKYTGDPPYCDGSHMLL